MPFKMGIFVAKKNGESKLVKWLPETYPSYALADKATEEKNRDLKVPSDGIVHPGRKFAMFDSV